MKLILIILLILTQITLGQYYYQNREQLVVNSKIVEIKLDESKYTISSGKVSSNGQFISGFLMDKQFKKRVETNYNTHAIRNFIKLDSIDLVIFERSTQKIVFRKNIRHYSDLHFSPSNKYILIDNWPIKGTLIIDLTLGKIILSLPETQRPLGWVDDRLYVQEELSEGFRIQEFDPDGKEYRLRTNSFPVKTLHDLPQPFTILNSKTLLFTKTQMAEGSINTYLKLFSDQKVHLIEKFNGKLQLLKNNQNIFVSGRRESDLEGGFYNFDIEKKVVTRLFNGNIFEKKIKNMYVSGLSEIAQCGNEFLMVTLSFSRENENLLKFNYLSKEITPLTKSGYVSGPIGYYKE